MDAQRDSVVLQGGTEVTEIQDWKPGHLAAEFLCVAVIAAVMELIGWLRISVSWSQDGSRSAVFGPWVWELELNPQSPCKKLDVVSWVYNPSHAEVGRFMETRWIGNITHLEKIHASIGCLKHKVGRHLSDTLVVLWLPCICMPESTCTLTHTEEGDVCMPPLPENGRARVCAKVCA